MPLTILVVEDHAALRHRICAGLQKRPGFQAIEAADGLEAVQKAEQLRPDLVLLDVNLPKIHGFEAAKQILRIAPQTPILFMSMESSPDFVRQALGLGGRGYVHKASAANDLMTAIDAVLAGRQFVSDSVALPEPTDAPPARRHEIQFCPDDAAIVDSFTRFVVAARNAGDPAIVIATAAHQARLLQGLRAQGVDIDGAIERGLYLSLDADVAPPLIDAINGAREAAIRAGKAHPRVAVCGERAGRLWASGRTEEAMLLERLGNELPADVDILCAYPVPYTEDQILAHVCAEHTAVV